MFSAKGRAFNLEPGAMPPGFMEAQTPALKARFIFGLVQKLDESRLQRLFARALNSWGDAPG
jgi:hypothetical protein